MSLKAIKRNKHGDRPDTHSSIFPVVRRRKSAFMTVEFEPRIRPERSIGFCTRPFPYNVNF